MEQFKCPACGGAVMLDSDKAIMSEAKEPHSV